jgi:hypothetical protein
MLDNISDMTDYLRTYESEASLPAGSNSGQNLYSIPEMHGMMAFTG